MKELTALVLGALLLTACANSDTTTTKQSPAAANEPATGSDRDAHSCIGSAGYTWSELRQTCIRVFSDGQRLNPVAAPADSAVISAFVVYNADKSKLELFLPHRASTTILPKSADGVYQSGEYKFVGAEQALYVGPTKKYQASPGN